MSIFHSVSSISPPGFIYTKKADFSRENKEPVVIYADSLPHATSKMEVELQKFTGLIVSKSDEYKITNIHQTCWHLELDQKLWESYKEIAQSHLQILTTKTAHCFNHQKLQKRFELLSNVAREGLIFHKNGIIADVNQAILRMFEIDTPETVVGRNILEFTAPEEHEKVINRIKNRIAYTYESVCIKEDHTRFPVRVTGFNYDIEGETYRVAAIHDISDLKKTEEELRVTNERLSLIAKSTGSGHYDWSFPEGELFWNSTMHEMFELPVDSRKDKNLHFHEMVHPEDQQRLKDSFITSTTPGRKEVIFTTEFRVKTPNSSTKHIEVLSIHKRNKKGEVIRIIGVCTDITKRKKNEQSLKDSEAMLKLVINAIPQNLYWKDKDSKYLGCNDNFAKLINLKDSSQIEGLTDFDVTTDHLAAERFIKWDQDIMNSGVPEYHKLVHEKNKNGTKSWIDISKTPIKNHKGQIIGTLGTFEDVTKREESQTQIHKLTRAIDQSVNGIAITNLNGVVEYANPKLGQILGVSPKKLVTSNYCIFNESYYPNPKKVKQEVLKGNDWKEEIQLSTENGKEKWINSSLSSIKDLNGNTTHFLSVQNDISQQYQIRTELKNSEAKYQLMLEQLPVAIIEFDMEMNVYYANYMALKLYGKNKGDSPNINILQLIDTSDQEKIKSNILNKLFSDDQSPVEYWGITKTGKKVPVLVYTNLIHNNDKIIGIRAAVIDITERKEAEKEAIEQNFKLESTTITLQRTNIELNKALDKAKKSKELEAALEKIKETQSRLVQAEKMATVGVLSAGIAHEINNPLNFIKGGNYAITEYIEDHIDDPDAKEELLELTQMIDEGVDRTSNIVNSLNRFSRNSKARHELCDFHQIIENCLTILHNQLKFKINIEKKLSSVPAQLKGNEGELHQVILNILHNSVQAISDKGKIEIVTKVTSDNILVQISDNGYGIDPENLKKVTDPFFTTKAPGSGTGLGMSISYNIVHKHGGTISYQSPNQKGCIVELNFNLEH